MTKRDIEYNVPLRLPIPGEDTEAMFRRLVAFSYAIGRQYRADGGAAEIEDAIRTARSVGDQRAMSHMEGAPGVIEKQDVKIREPLSGYEMTVGRFPKQTAPAIEGALQTASEIAPYFTPAAPIAAARDVAVGLREGNIDDLAMSAFGIPGKLGRLAKSAAVGAYALAPEEAEAGTVGKALRAIRAYHGSPYAFDRFDLSKIGTGEGAQVYGHGLYFAESEPVARSYRDNLQRVKPSDLPEYFSPGNVVPSYFGKDKVLDFKQDKDGHFEVLVQEINNAGEPVGAPRVHSTRPSVESFKQVTGKNPGHMYEVDIHADPEHFLDWDRPLAEQPRIIQERFSQAVSPGSTADDELLRELYGEKLGAETLGLFDKSKGSQAYNTLVSKIGGASKATDALREAGVPGIKYLDAGSRATGEGSRNYVVFDDKLIDILRRYAQGGEVDGYAGGGAIRKAMEIAQDIIHSQKKAPKIENLARVADKFVYHSGIKPDIEHMTPYLEPQHGSWIKEVASGAVDDPEEFLENANPLLWMSDKPTWVKAKIGRHLEKPFNQITDDDIRNYGHVALIPRKSYEAENIWGVGPEGLSEGQYSTVSNLKTGKPTAAYNTDLYHGGREPFGVERNEYISAQPIEPMYHLTGDALLNFLKLTKNRSVGGEVEREEYEKGGAAVSLAKALLSLHNIRSHRLDMAEKLGGLPVPSIAIKDPEHGFNSFGDITLVGGKELATPSRTNPVFASDVYSPRFPSLDDSGEKIFRGFTPSGNRRYAPLTLENVVREMKGNIRGGEGYNYGAGNIRAAVTPQFKSLKDVQSARGKIIPEEEFGPHKEEANRMLFELADKFHPYSKYSNSGFGHAQAFSETLADIGRGRHSAWAQDYEPLPPELKAEAMGYLSHLKNMPTEYFEAKPQRAVGFGEFSGAVVPESLMKEYAPRLKNLGVREVVPFNPELTGSQQKALREFSGMHFNDGGSVINDALDVVYGLPRAAEAETSA